MNKVKRIFVDVETSGLSSYRDQLLQIAAIIDVDGDQKDDISMLIEPEVDIPQRIYNLIGKTPEDFEKDSIPSKEAWIVFKQFMAPYVDNFEPTDKLFLYAYNSPFDVGFLRAWWKKFRDNYFGSYFWVPDICVMRLAMDALAKERHTLPNFRLGTVAGHIGLLDESMKLHDAMTDVVLARDIYYATRGGYSG